jgi:uncharacterized protein YuzE
MKTENWYDEEEDILGIRVREGEYWKSVELPGGIIIDIDKNGEILGFEIWKASKLFLGDAKKIIDSAKLGSEKKG